MSSKLFLSIMLLFVLVSFLFVGSVGASSGMWSQTYGGIEVETAYSLVETSDGGFALAGGSLLVKTDSHGNMEWNKRIGGSIRSLIETSDGGYALTGASLLVKTDAYGNMEWKQTYGGTSLVETSDGGYAYSTGGSCQLVKTDANGNIQWNRTYKESAGFYSLHELVETSDGGYALAGCGGFIMTGFWLVKTDEYGNMEWDRGYGEYGTSTANSLVETSDGGYALAGDTNPFGPGGFDFFLVKTDTYGNMEWSRTYGETGWDTAHSLVVTSDGGYALAGTMNAYTTDNSDFLLVKTDANGNLEWNRTYGGTSEELAYSLVQTSDGGYAIAGETSSFGAGDSDFWLVKTDEYGIIPEFPSWIIIPLFLTATLAAIFYSKRVRARLRHF